MLCAPPGLRAYEPCGEVDRTPHPGQSLAPVVATLISQPAPARVRPETRAPANCEGSGFAILHQNRQKALRQPEINSLGRLQHTLRQTYAKCGRTSIQAPLTGGYLRSRRRRPERKFEIVACRLIGPDRIRHRTVRDALTAEPYAPSSWRQISSRVRCCVSIPSVRTTRAASTKLAAPRLKTPA
jgi:hypothetical protein